MTMTVEAGSPKSHRRRKTVGTETKHSNGDRTPRNDDYYDNSDEKKDHRSHEDKMRESASSLGRFFLYPCICLASSGRRFYHCISSRRKRTLPLSKSLKKGNSLLDDWVDLALLAGAILSGIVCIYCFFPQFFSMRYVQRHLHHGIRPTTDADVDRIEVRIPRLDFDNNAAAQVDIGGWMHFHKFFDDMEPVDFGEPDLEELLFLGKFGEPRAINPNDAEAAERYWEKNQPRRKKLKLYEEYAETLEDTPQECRRVDWKLLYSPTCNALHEINLSLDYNEEQTKLGDDQAFDTFYISHGYYRDVWVVNQPDQGVKSILKVTRFKHDRDIETMFSDLRDALVMERLTASPRIIDIYGHCGTAVWVEAMPYEVEEVIVHGEGYSSQKDLHDEVDVNPLNRYSATEKLEIALSMAESIADLHGFKDGPIVHDDVQLCQWLRTRDGILKLGDFNRAEIFDYNEEKGEYCVYNNGKGYGNYRSPEEFKGDDLDEKIDMFSFGNNIYALLTGLWVFYENEDDTVVQNKLIKGETAYIDPRYKDRSYAERTLIEIMERCWAFKPDERIDIFEVVRLLREAVSENKKLEEKAKT